MWNHILIHKSGNKFSAFLNGRFSDEGNFNGSNYINSETFKLAKSPSGGSDLFVDCSVDDVRIYDRALSAEEIRFLYRQESPNHFVDLNSTVDLDMVWVEPWNLHHGTR